MANDWITEAARLSAQFRDLAGGDKIRVRLDVLPRVGKNRWGGDVVVISIIRKRDDVVSNLNVELSPGAFTRLAKVVAPDQDSRVLSKIIEVREVSDGAGRKHYEFVPDAGGH